MKALQQFWESNDLQAFLMACGAAIAVLAVLALARFIAARVLASLARRRIAAGLDENAARVVGATNLWLLAPLAVNAGASLLDLPARVEHVIGLAAVGGLVLQAGLWATRATRDWIEGRIARHGEGGDGLMALALLGFAVRVAIWTIVLLALLDQMGFNITALVAGLGIGGVAIALAVQNILGDLFASLSIVLDRPFVVGDFIVVDGLRGTVDRVGVKTTRVRSLDGEMLVFSNSDLLKSRIRNFKQMAERRVVFSVGITYQTPAGKVRRVPALLRRAVQAQSRARFDRAHFKEYGESALVFETVYFVLDADYNVYMDTQQAINLDILARFEAEAIEFAYPTRTLHLPAGAIAVERGAPMRQAGT